MIRRTAIALMFMSAPIYADIIINTNTTWDTTVNPRVLNQTVRIQSGATLTILPGVILKPTASTNTIQVEVGGLNANQVIFTSYKDDAHGGDTNGDGNLTTPAPGDWGGLFFQNGTVDAPTTLNGCQFIYGNPVQVIDASPNFTNNQFSLTNGTAIGFSGQSFPTGNGNAALNNPVNGIEIPSFTINQSGTWSNLGIPYVIRSGVVTVAAANTLTLAPGVVVKLFGGGRLVGSGPILAQGTPSLPIVFTSLRDDTYGGDTNTFEGTVSPAAANWRSLSLDNALSLVQNAVVRYGGSGTNAPLETSANNTLRSTLIEQAPYGLSISNNSAPLIEGCTFQFITNYGVRGHDLNMGAAIIRNNLFQNINSWAMTLLGNASQVSGNRIINTAQGIYFEGSGTPIVSQNQFGGLTANLGIIYLNNPNVFPQQLSSNVLIATNAVSGIEVVNNTAGITTSGTWDSTNVPYVIRSGVVTVAAANTLTIAPGVVVKLFGAGRLVGSGPILAQGTPSLPIVFTSLRDDTYGGDTNTFEGTVSPAAANWRSLSLDNALSLVQNAVVRYGGSGSNASLETSANNTIRSTLIEQAPYGLSISNNSAPLIEGCTFQFITNYGVRGHDLNMGAAIIRNNLFQNINSWAMTLLGNASQVSGNRIINTAQGIYFEGSGTPIVSQNQFGGLTANLGIIYLNNPNVFPQQLSSNVLIATNAVSGIEVVNNTAGITTSGTWDSTNVPYVIRSGVVTVAAANTLTLAPGVVVKLFGGGRLVGSGPILAQGTPSLPIVFTSLRDDTYGGDTNTFEGNISPAPSDWGSLRLDNALSLLQNAVVRYGGSGSNAPLETSANNTIRFTLIEQAPYGLSISNNSAPLIEGCTFQFITNFGVRGHDLNMGAAIIRNNLFQNINSWAMTLLGNASQVSNNRLINSDRGIYFEGSGTPIVSQNQFGGLTGNNGVIYLNNPNVFPQQLSSNVLIATNAVSGIEVVNNTAGITTSGTWDCTTIPYVMRNTTLFANQTLTLTAGTVVKLYNSAIVANNLQSQGTSSQRVVFTSLRDDTIGGNTNLIEGNITPSPSDWHYVRADHGLSSINHTLFKYGGNQNGQLFLRGGGTQTVSNCEFTLSQQNGIFTDETNHSQITQCLFSNMNTGVRVTANSSPTLHQSSFGPGLTFGVDNQNTITMDARNNWWGHPSGPLDNSDDRPTGGYYNPTGQGVQVTNFVNYTPWIGNTVLSSPTVTITEGPIVSGPLIHLALSVIGPVTSMRISESSSFPVNWETFTSSRAWTLSNGDGQKTIYAQFRASDGSVSDIASANVLLQTAAPSAAITLSSSSPMGLGNVTVTLQATETLSDIPLLTWTPLGQSSSTISLTTQNYLIFTGSFTISSQTTSGLATFGFRGVDLSSTVGTQITSGATFFIDTQEPISPILHSAIPQRAGGIHLTWSDPSNENPPRFLVFRATESITNFTNNTLVANNISTTTFLDIPSIDGIYFYAVKTKDVANNIGPFSNVISTFSDRTPPLPVTRLSATGLSTLQLNLSWQAPSSEAPTSYQLYRAIGSTPSVQAQNLIYQTTNFSFVDTLSQTGRYYYGVTTRDTLGNESTIVTTVIFDVDITSPTVASLQLTPRAPVKLGPLVIAGQFSEEMNTTVPIQVTLLGFGASTGISVSSTSFSSMTWTGVVSITTSVPEGLARLVWSGGRDLANNILSPSTFTFLIDYSAPSVPSNTAATLVGNGRDVRVNWSASEAGATYTLFRSTNNQSTWQPIAINISTTTSTDAPPAFSTSVFYAVTARDNAQNESALSISTNVPSPFVPFIVSPSNNFQSSSSSVTISGQSQRGTTVKIFSSSGTLLAQGATSINSDFSLTIALPQEGTNDIYCVTVDSAQNTSGPSSLRRIVLDSRPLPVGLPQGTVHDTFVSLQWPSSNEPDIIGYWLYRDGSDTPIHLIRVGISSSPQFKDLGLTNGRSYSYRVAAEDAQHQIGPKSNPVTLTPLAGIGWTPTP